MTLLEISANFVTSISILLAGRNSVHTWWAGIVGCLLFADLFYQAKLYADVLLQLFFLAASALGWWNWQYGERGHEKPVNRASITTIVVLLPFALLAAASYGYILHRFSDAYAPFLDSGILVFSVIAQWLMIQRRLECWAFWLLVNSIAVPLYANRELYLTAILYSVYWVNAVVAYRYWRSQLKKPGKCEAELYQTNG